MTNEICDGVAGSMFALVAALLAFSGAVNATLSATYTGSDMTAMNQALDAPLKELLAVSMNRWLRFCSSVWCGSSSCLVIV